MIDLQKLDATPLETSPYEYIVVEDFVSGAELDAVRASYPEVPGPGVFPSEDLEIKGAFHDLMGHLTGPDFQAAVEKKFNIDLEGRPIAYTVRGECRARDGKMHTDSKSKLITVLLYFNEDNWSSEGGRLRVLNSGKDMDDYAAEIEPRGGNLLIFKRADNSWHGHHSFEGPRRAVQMNWVTDESALKRAPGKRKIGARIKRLFGA